MSKKKLFIIFGIIALVLAIGATAAYFILNLKKEKVEEKKETKKSIELKWDQEAKTSDPFNDKNGPFYHKIFKATSQDGLNFTKVEGEVFDKASVPDIVKMPDGKIFFYAVDGAQRSKSSFMVALSEDNGETWKAGSLQMKANDEDEPRADPEIILLPDGKLRLFYVVFPKNKPPLDATGKPIPTGEKVKIKSAISEDGVNFTEEDGVRYESAEIITDPDIIKIGSKWFMYISEGKTNIALSSDDGMNYKLEKPIRTDGSVSKTVSIGDGKYRQFFCKAGISSAVTTDGLIWVDDSGSRIYEEPGKIFCDPAPLKLDKGWVMFYKVQDAQQGSPVSQPPGGPDNKPPL